MRFCLALSVLAAVVLGPHLVEARAPVIRCAGAARAVVVDTRNHTLALCADGAATEVFAVALGTGGVDKRRQGDNRTPRGAYPLGAPRPSRDFGTFIPVAYPTRAQARAGFTGSAIGIHGPPRAFAWAGPANVATDWTAGCIAVASDAEITRIAGWIRAH